MFNKFLIFFKMLLICAINGQELEPSLFVDYDDIDSSGFSHIMMTIPGDPCETDDGIMGSCKYEQVCRYTNLLNTMESHVTICSYEDRQAIVCCPESFPSPNRFISTKTSCHYGGSSPTMCPSPFIDASAEIENCPPLETIPTPPFSNPAHTIAWKKCIEINQRYVNVCEGNEGSYRRVKRCALPTTDRMSSDWVVVEPKELPHMALLGSDSSSDGNVKNGVSWHGAGSLISDRFILTAAHVLHSTESLVQLALLGNLNKTDINNGELHFIKRLLPHYLYYVTSKLHDIALIELESRVIFSQFVRPICLPNPGIPPENNIRLTAGWYDGSYQDHQNQLVMTNVAVVNSSQCSYVQTWLDFAWNDDAMICAGGMETTSRVIHTCQKQSGSPLMYKVTNSNFDCNYVISGLVSWGHGTRTCAPATYTSVSAYIGWIVRIVWTEGTARH